MEPMDTYWDNENSKKGIQIENGIMTLGDEPLYMAGVNCYNLFNQALETLDEELAYRALKELSDNRVKVVRFNCGGYDYSYLDRYYESKSKYVSLLKKIALKAEEYEIGLIPSFFWLHHAVPDYFDEPISCWGRKNTQTTNFLVEYTTTVVSALKDCKAIFAWEFGNEFNLACNLWMEHVPALPPHSTRGARTIEDLLSAYDVETAFKIFAGTIREVDDTGRMITSGNASQRSAQYNLLHNHDWNQDTYEQFTEMMGMFAPEGMDCVGEHIYYDEQKPLGSNLTLSQYLAEAKSIAQSMGKAYYIGEWGGGTHDYDYYNNLAQTFVDADIQLFLLWNYNLYDNRPQDSFTANNERGRTMLKMLRDTNENLAKKHQ